MILLSSSLGSNKLKLFVKSFQIFDNALIVAGLMDDPREMVGRLNMLLTKALHKITAEQKVEAE